MTTPTDQKEDAFLYAVVNAARTVLVQSINFIDLVHNTGIGEEEILENAKVIALSTYP